MERNTSYVRNCFYTSFSCKHTEKYAIPCISIHVVSLFVPVQCSTVEWRAVLLEMERVQVRGTAELPGSALRSTIWASRLCLVAAAASQKSHSYIFASLYEFLLFWSEPQEDNRSRPGPGPRENYSRVCVLGNR